MILTATINEVKRRITFDNPNAVVAVKGDYEVNGVAFAFPAIYEDDFDLSTAVKTVYYKATDGIIYNHVVTDTDTDTGYPLWVFKDEINKGAYGDVEFALVCDKVENGAIVKRWVSVITAFRVQKSIEIDESEQEDNEQTYSERLAYLMTQMANMQVTVNGLASGVPTAVSLASAMTDTSKLYVYTGSESGYTAGHWYYYNGSAWADGGQYGGASVDPTLTVSGAAADAKVTGDKIAEIKEDLSAQSLDIQSVSTLLSYPRNLFNKNFSDSTHTFSGWRQYSTIGSNGEVVYNSAQFATTTYLRTYGTKTVDIRYGSAQKFFAERNVACYTASKKFIGFCSAAVDNVRTLLDGTVYIIVEKYFGTNATTSIGNRVCVNPDWSNAGVYSAYHVPFNPNDVNLMQIFPKYTTIGDSLMCGFVNNGAASVSSAVAKEAGNNWVNYISLRIGRPFINVAVGGSTTADWRNTHIPTANVDTDCYIIGLGANDERHSGTIGTSADIKTDFSNNSDSFYGNYDYIIRQLMAWQNKAHIFCLTIPATETADVSGFNTAISYIAGLYPDKVHVIDLNEDIGAYMLPIIADNFLGAHYNPVAYNIMSGIIEKAINKYMYINYSAFLGTPYA